MAQMSLYLFVSGGLSLLFALFFHVAYTTMLAQRGGVAALRLAPARLVGVTAGGSATVPLGGGGPSRTGGPTRRRRWARSRSSGPGSAGCSLGALAASPGRSWSGAGRGARCSSSRWPSPSASRSGYLYLQRRYPHPLAGLHPDRRGHLPARSTPSRSCWPSRCPARRPWPPSSRSCRRSTTRPLLTIHVAMAMISYGIFAVSFAAARGLPDPGPRATGSPGCRPTRRSTRWPIGR